MSRRLSIAEFVAAVPGSWHGPAPSDWSGQRGSIERVVIDSRQVRWSDIFWALPGTRRDGAEFISPAFQRGAWGAVTTRVCEPPPEERWLYVVDNAERALEQAAAAVRGTFTGQVVAVTGSVGKTTTREVIRAVLGSAFETFASPANYNNQLGLPLSMVNTPRDARFAVWELGANRPGEIAELARVARPHVGVITRLGEAHVGGFGDVETLARTKTDLLAALPSEGLAVLNADDPRQRRWAHRSPAPIVWIGTSGGADVRAEHVTHSQGRLNFVVDGDRYTLPVWGRHQLTSALAAVALGRWAGLSAPRIAEALALFEPVAQRCQVRTHAGVTLLDDTYNASPSAFRAALDLLQELELPGRRAVVAGDMAELGDDAPRFAETLGEQIVTIAGADLLIACGEQAPIVIEAARRAGLNSLRAIACDTPCEAGQLLARWTRAGDGVLVKGSRFMQMETCLETWEACLAHAAPLPAEALRAQAA